MSVTTWANGFGRWHARVPATPDAAKVAQRAIRAELVARGAVGKGFRVLVVPVTDAESYRVPNTLTYAERIV